MQTKLIRRHHVACYNTDEMSRLKLASLLDFAQDMAGDHADILGFGSDELLEQRIVWILSRIKVQMYEYPLWREEIELTTWHRGLDGPFYIRDYEVRNNEGRIIGRMTTSWLFLDIDSRKMVRSSTIATDEEGICHDVALSPIAARIRLPKDIQMENCYSHVVRYSDIDKNKHVNNVCYTVWAIDAIDHEYLVEHPVKGYEINFVKESRPGDEVDIHRGKVLDENGDTVWYVEGYIGEHQSFISRITF